MAEHALRIGYLTSQYPATSHTFISREVAALRELGVDVQTFSIRAPGDEELNDETIAREARSTFTVLKQPFWRFVSAHAAAVFWQPGRYLSTLGLAMTHRAPGLRGLALAFAHFAEAVVLAGELKRRRIDRLHNHFANSGATVGLLASHLLRIPWSFTIHGISEFDYPAGLMLGRKIEAAGFVACVSWFGRAQAMRLVEPGEWGKLHVVRCGLPLANLPAHAKPRATKRIICVGRLSAEKGQAGLLEAFAEVAKDHKKVELILVGDGPERELLRDRADALGIKTRVNFIGRRGEDDTLEQIAQSDILVLSSFMEGLPIVLMEAMAIGTAVIASRVAGVPELVEDRKSGLLFTPSDWDGLAECMRELIDDDALRAKLIRGGRAAVKTEYDVANSAAKLRDLFDLGTPA